MQWGKSLKVAIVVGVVLFALLFTPYWTAVGRPPHVPFAFLKGQPMVKHGLFPGASRGARHGCEWAVFCWRESYKDVVARAKIELKGWEVDEIGQSPDYQRIFLSSRTSETMVVIEAEDPPAKGESWDTVDPIPNPNSVIVQVRMEIPDNSFNDFRTQNFYSQP
jgi:hypothetical protein